MKKIIDFLFGWLKESNRMAHLKVGAIITAVMLVLCGMFNLYAFFLMERSFRADFAVTSAMYSCVIALVTTLIAMASVEYIQSKMGGEADMKDIYAGVLVPFFLSVTSFVLFLTIV